LKGTVSRVLYFDPACRRGRNDGHLSGILIAQDLKRPYPSRLYSVEGINLNGLFLSPHMRLCRNKGIDKNVILNLFQDLINSTNCETLK